MVDRSRLVLGTVQLGVPYGIANRSGQPVPDEAARIVATAWRGGIHRFDTAPAYGDSETVLGAALRTLGAAGDAVITTKVGGDIGVDALVASVRRSLAHLGVGSIDTLLLHSERSLDDWSAIRGALRPLLDAGQVGRLGISVYTPERARQAVDMDGIGVIQIPGNVFDRRFADPGFVNGAAARGVELMIRSVFLQGLLLMAPGALPDHLASAAPALGRVHAVAAGMGIEHSALLLGYVAGTWPGARVLFGAECVDQVEANLRAWDAGLAIDAVAAIDAVVRPGDVPDYVIRPDQWRKP